MDTGSSGRRSEPFATESRHFYVVATPIGNLDDISARALRVLSEVDVILAEDSRHTKRLLSHHGITTPIKSHHAHNEKQQIEFVIEKLLGGENFALVSDAGTPLISDPGQQTIAALRTSGCQVVPIPGACAVIAALSASGLPTHRFTFEGFCSSKTTAREKQLQALVDETRTCVFYEAPHRIKEFIQSCLKVFGEHRNMSIAREITKMHETFIHGTIAHCLQEVTEKAENQLGEFVVMIQGAEPVKKLENHRIDTDALLQTLLKTNSVKQAAVEAAALTGLKKNALYQRALEIQDIKGA